MPVQPHNLFGMRTLLGLRILELAHDGATLSSVQGCVEVIAVALAQEADIVAIPIARLDAKFFRLSTGFAGEVLQKFANYRLRAVILGDHSFLAVQSEPLRDFIRESNRGRAVWFLDDWESLEDKLRREAKADDRPSSQSATA